MKTKKGQMKTKKLKISSLQLSNKGQLKIQQMSFMLIAVTLLFALAGMFILSIFFSGLKEEATNLEEKNAITLSMVIANSPEFSCGYSYGTEKIACIDTDKVIKLKENIDKYKNFWGTDTNIEIRKIYPITTDDVDCNIRNYPNCNIINLKDEEIEGGYSNFALLCRKEVFEGQAYNKCDLGKIIISYKDYRET